MIVVDEYNMEPFELEQVIINQAKRIEFLERKVKRLKKQIHRLMCNQLRKKKNEKS